MSAVYRNTRPSLVVELVGSKKLGNCFYATYYRVTSTDRLSGEKLNALRKAGFLGGGQGFYVKSPCNGTEEPAGHDTLECVDDETGKPAVNEYSGKPYAPSKSPYFYYNVEDQCDSGD